MSSAKQQQLRPWIKWTWIIPLAALIDQISKQLIVTHMQLGESIHLTPFLNLTFAINRGAAFSFLSDASGWQTILFSTIAVVAIIMLFYWLVRLPQKERIMSVALCLIIGGAIGNLLDRLKHKYVVDFVDFHIKNWHFAIFNIADAAVSIGAFIIILRTLFAKTK